jgi:site-specific DNA recombinase
VAARECGLTTEFRVGLNASKLIVLLGVQDARSTGARAAGAVATIDLPCQLKQRGVEAKLVVGGGRYGPIPDAVLTTLIAKAHQWLRALLDRTAHSITELAAQENGDRNEISRYLPLAFLAPDIVEKILEGTQPADLTVEKLRRLGALPYQWDEQRALLGLVD